MIAFYPGTTVSSNPAYNPGGMPGFDGGGFLPNFLSGIQLWLDASNAASITSSAGKVSQWDDKSGLSNNAAQGTEANQPTTGFSMNSHNSIDWDGTADDMSIASFTSILSVSNAYSVFMVFKLGTDETSNDILLSSTVSSSNRMALSRDDSQHLVCATYDGSYNSKTVAFTDTASPHVVTMLHTAADVVTAFLDGTEMTLTTEVPVTSNTAGTVLGARTASDAWWNGLISEVIVYDRVVNAAERTAVENYLAGKWGVTITTPANIAGLQLWLDADDLSTITEVSGKVSQWDDKSSAGNNVTQGVADDQPTTNATTHNSRNVLDFDGTNDFLLIPSGLYGIPAGNNTTFMVVKSNLAETVQRMLFLGISGSTKMGFTYEVTAGVVLFIHGGAPQVTGVTESNFNIFRGRRSGTTEAISLNGATEVTDTSAVDNTANEASIGSYRHGSDNFLNGSIAEVLIYNRSLTSAEITSVEVYLSNKWGITLA